MPKPKHFAKESKKTSAKHAAQTPQTADDYLADGVDLEGAGEKWRAGDAAKSTRFFVRAIDTYDDGLRKFPLSFDLAYNKARVQYELTQNPRLVDHLPRTLIDLLKAALQTSRVALNLRQDNADVLFNTAQVLTSLADALTDDPSGEAPNQDALRLLEEAIGLFQRCLTIQESEYDAQAQEEQAAGRGQAQEVGILDAEAPSSPATSTSETAHYTSASEAGSSQTSENAETLQEVEEHWATVVEPLTHDILLDTVFAQVDSLAFLCGLISIDHSRGLAWIEEYATELLTTKLPIFLLHTDREEEAALTRAKFIAALAKANFRCQHIDATTYQRAIEDAFGATALDVSHNPEGLCDKAEALIAYSDTLGRSSVAENLRSASRWNALTTALESLTRASQLPTAQNITSMHLLRGDVELLRYRLSQAPVYFSAAVRSAQTLLRNAATYYRGAIAEARTRGDEDVEEQKQAIVKEGLSEAMGGQANKLRQMLTGRDEEKVAEVRRILEEAVESELVSGEWLNWEGTGGV